MRRTKSIMFVLVLALMVFGMVSAANAAGFSDIADNPAKNDIIKLNALGVINGYPDGTFQPAGEITRAEFAKIAVIMAGLKNSADLMKDSPSRFSDVPAGQWYTGWVNVAAAQGYVKGDPNGTFRPEDKVTAQEVVTVLLRLMGYDDRLPGEWPVDYMSKASKLGITDDLSFVASAPASRALVCQLAAAALEEDVVNYDNDREDFFVKEDGLTLLADNFDEGVLVEDVLVKAVKFNKDEYQMDGYQYDDDVREADRDINNLTFADGVVVAGAPSIFALEGSIVNYIVDEDDEVVFVELADGISKVFGRMDSYEMDGDAIESVEIEEEDYDVNEKFFVSLSKMSDYEYDAEDFDGETLFNSRLVDYKVTAYLNDDNEVVFIYRTSPDAAYIVDEVDVEDGEIDPKQGSKVKDMDEDDDFIIVKNGAPIKLEEVKEGDVFYNVASGDTVARGFDRYIVVVEATVTGEFSRYNEDDVEDATDDDTGVIGGTKYDFASPNGNQGLYLEDESGDEVEYADIDTLMGEEVTVYLDGNKEVTYITGKSSESGKLVGAIVDIGDVEGRGETTQWVEIFTTDGKSVSYDIEADYWDDEEEDIVEVCGDFNDEDESQEFSMGIMVEYSLNADGEIDDISLLEDDDDIDVYTYEGEIADPEEDYDRLHVDGAWRYVEDGTVVIDLVYDDEDNEVDPELSSWDEIEDTDELLADVYYDGEDIEYIVIWNTNGISESDIDGVYVGSYKNSDGDWMGEFYVDGELVEYEITSAQRSDLVKGYIYTFDASNDEIDDLEDAGAFSFRIADDGVNDRSLDLEYDSVHQAAYSEDTTANAAYNVYVDFGSLRVDSETVYIEKDGNDFEVITLDDLSDGDIVRILEGLEEDDEDGIAKIVVLLSDEDDLDEVEDAYTEPR